MRIPKKLHRTTNHARPRHQVWQPGFNASNSCWLEGQWVTIGAWHDADLRAKVKAHEKLYKGLHEQVKKQHHRGKPTPIKAMTPAQRQAWEFFSGEGRLDCRHVPSGTIGPVGVRLAADKPDEKSIAWMRKRGYRVIPLAKQPDGKVTDQRSEVPPDLLTGDTEPVGVWQGIVRQNRDRAEEMSRALATDPGPMGDFGIGIAMHGLTELEESIMRDTLRQTPDLLETPEEVRARYVALRRDLEAALGDRFQEHHGRARDSHNGCARTNLDNSKGHLYCFVLPRFNPDGTHEPIGPRDFPWAYPKEYALPRQG